MAGSSSPPAVPGRDYPQTWTAFLRRFPDDDACAAYLERLRWPDGFRCPKCGAAGEPYRASRGRLACSACRHQASVTAGTIFHKTRTPLTSWFAAAWYATNQKLGVSALGLQRVLGLGSYQTAWLMLHKLRRAMVRPGRDRLVGNVEVDESYVGGVEKGVSGRETYTKATVAIAVEVFEPKGMGRVRMQRIPDVSSESLTAFVQGAVSPGSLLLTDGWGGYDALTRLGYRRKRTVLSASGSPAHVVLPAVHRVASLLKRWLLGTHQGAVRRPHLDDYLNEYTFRFNRRRSRSRGLLFFRLLHYAVVTDPAPYRDVVADQAEDG